MTLRAVRCALRLLGALLPLVLVAPLHAQPRVCTPVAAHALVRGQTLTVDDIAVGGACSQRAALVGSITRRVIAAGEVLREPAVAPPNVIEANQQVSVVYRDGGIELRLTGVAANAAPAGGRVTVRIAGQPRAGQPSRSLDGVAVSAGLVQVK